MELRVSYKGLTTSVSKRRIYRYSYNVYTKRERERGGDSLPIKPDF